ncbi:hypothetical protein ACFLSE_01375 [Bacteroidota bacterium]
MRFILILIISISTFNFSTNSPEISKKARKELEKYYSSELLSLKEITELGNRDDLFIEVIDGEKDLGIVVLTSAKGRYDLFDYMIIYNLNFEIELIKVLVYRSDYGSEITAKRWLSQFYKKEEDNFKYGSNIQAITGATFSASSLTKNVNRINKILKEYKGD